MHIFLNRNISSFIETYFAHLKSKQTALNWIAILVWNGKPVKVQVHLRINWTFFSVEQKVLNHFRFSWRKVTCVCMWSWYWCHMCSTSTIPVKLISIIIRNTRNFFLFWKNIVDYLRGMWFCMQIQYSTAIALMFRCNVHIAFLLFPNKWESKTLLGCVCIQVLYKMPRTTILFGMRRILAYKRIR